LWMGVTSSTTFPMLVLKCTMPANSYIINIQLSTPTDNGV
jgi:hypothetical protein